MDGWRVGKGEKFASEKMAEIACISLKLPSMRILILELR